MVIDKISKRSYLSEVLIPEAKESDISTIICQVFPLGTYIDSFSRGH